MVEYEGIFIATVYLGCVAILHHLFQESELESREIKNRVPFPIPFSIIVAQGFSFILTNILLLISCLVMGPRIARYELVAMKLSLLPALAIEPLVYQRLARRGPNKLINTACNKLANAGLALYLGEYMLVFVAFAAGVCTLFCAVSPVSIAPPKPGKPLVHQKAIQAAGYSVVAQAVALASRWVEHDRAVLYLFADNLALWGPLIATSLYIPVDRKWTSLAFSGLCSLPLNIYGFLNAQPNRDACFLAYTRFIATCTAGLVGGIWRLYATGSQFDYLD